MPLELSPAAKDLLAGTSAGVVSVLVCHPLDTIRVRLQTAPAGRFTGVGDVVRQTIRGEGARALYKGIASPLLAQGLQKATMFFSFGLAKRTLAGDGAGAGQTLPLPHLFLCGSFAGMANSLVASPFELVRNRLQVQYHRHISSAQYKGPFDCARQIVAQSGVRSLWLGVGPMMLRDAPGVGAWYCTFEGVRRLLVPAGEDPATTPKWKILVAGAAAGVGFWTCAFPQDTIKNIILFEDFSKLFVV
jgi:solute carrier family 25 carnitine/acylcarnitine transporter 20/29